MVCFYLIAFESNHLQENQFDDIGNYKCVFLFGYPQNGCGVFLGGDLPKDGVASTMHTTRGTFAIYFYPNPPPKRLEAILQISLLPLCHGTRVACGFAWLYCWRRVLQNRQTYFCRNIFRRPPPLRSTPPQLFIRE